MFFDISVVGRRLLAHVAVVSLNTLLPQKNFKFHGDQEHHINRPSAHVFPKLWCVSRVR